MTNYVRRDDICKRAQPEIALCDGISGGFQEAAHSYCCLLFL